MPALPKGQAGLNVVRQPEVEPLHGRWRVFLRTDGRYIVYDEERPAGNRTVSVHGTQDEAVEAMRRMPAKEASKIVPIRPQRPQPGDIP